MDLLFCDSNCELWFDKVEDLGLKFISMPYSIDGVEYFYDLGKATDFKKFYDTVRLGSIPITSALNPQNYVEIFEPYFKNGDNILYISFSHAMSSTFEYLQVALSELKDKYKDAKFTLFNTKMISMGAGLIVYEAGKMHKEGRTNQEILHWLNSEAGKARAIFAVDDLNHLKRGGRIRAGQAIVGTIFNIKPLLNLNDGQIEKFGQAKGAARAMTSLIDKLADDNVDIERPICVLDADSEEAGSKLCALIEEHFGSKVNIIRQPVGPVIGTHCGPGTLGITYWAK